MMAEIDVNHIWIEIVLIYIEKQINQTQQNYWSNYCFC